MKVHLLILLALACLFCGVTRASPTELPEELGGATDALPQVTEGPGEEEHVVITGTAAPEPEAVPAQVTTETAAAEPATEAATEPATEAAAPEATAASATEAVTAVVPEVNAFTTEAAQAETAAAATDKPAEETDAVTEGPGVLETAATAAPQEVETEAAEQEKTAEMEGDVVVEDEELSSGQVVGIVIGALVAVVIVIAVVIALLRRMGKYSSAKKAKIVKRKRASWFL